jgi:hypothetical protein
MTAHGRPPSKIERREGSGMKLEFHQLDQHLEHLRVRRPEQQRRLGCWHRWPHRARKCRLSSSLWRTFPLMSAPEQIVSGLLIANLFQAFERTG